MKRTPLGRLVFFEPWSLGDVIIAASVLREQPDAPAAIACHSSWHPILRGMFSEMPQLRLIPVDLPYTTRTRTNAFDKTGALDKSTAGETAERVLSIRGDPRDFAAARKIFPRARIRMNGWVRFFARKSALVNLPYSVGRFPVHNRYRSWAKLSGVPYDQIEQTYRRLQSQAPANRSVIIHLGAQWRSKQFPDLVELRDFLRKSGYEVILVAGPTDRLVAEVLETDVVRAANQELIALLRSAEHVITNDSGPMHLAAFLGCRTLAIVRTSPIEEWLPPATRVVRSPLTPRGYRPHKRYMTDEALPGWPSVPEIVAAMRSTL